MVKSHRWHTTAIATAVAALFGLCGTNAAALSLGRVTVQSALGEPLRAEIEVPEINAEEAASLKATVALPETFRAAGLDYNPAMATLQATLQKRADGRSFIRLGSDRAVNEPFVDMIIEANWSTGRVVRDYTLLFDPPSLRQTAPAPTPAQIPAQALENKSTATSPASQAAAKVAEPAKASAKAPSRPTPVKAPVASGSQVTIKAGDTASKIASTLKPANVSLDQMLVALLRANPAAFIGDNVNRIKTGSVMNVPTAEQAAATPAPEATQIVVAQSKDFNDFRRKLAGITPTTQVASADRKASGSVQAKVEDKKATAATPDKLTLSKGTVKAETAEDKSAKDRTSKEAASRAAEISKNINELSKLGAASTAVSTAPVASSVKPAAPGLLPIPTTAATPAPAASATVVASSAPKLAASPAVAATPKPTASALAKTAATSTAQPSMLDGLLENPLLPVGAGGLIALLAGFGFYRSRQRKNDKHLDSSFLESRLQPDSFFGNSGGQSVDTNDNNANGSSMVYSPSQLDAVDDVDPVAEADVYLAYGRDLQAEEILKDALLSNPERLAIHQKLLEIYAKRNDTHNFEAIATQAFEVTSGQGQEWDHICELGLSIDPSNAFYLPGGQPNNPDGSPSSSAPLDFPNSEPFSRDSIATQPNELQPAEAAELDLDLDLDLDFSLDDEPESEAIAAIATPIKAAEASATPVQFDSNALDFDFEMTPEVAPPPASIEEEDARNGIEFTLPDLDFDVETQNPGLPEPVLDEDEFKQQAATSFGATGLAPLEAAEPTTPTAPDLSLLDFDLGSLSLDLNETPTSSNAAAEAAQEDPLGTKLALAEEFRAIGDEDGARALIEEVISEASGDMKIKAQRALNNL